jgi:hypothetical protein
MPGMDPVVIWPAAVSVWAGGWVATARQVYVSKPQQGAWTRNEAMVWALFWPAWVPVMYLAKTVRGGWRLAARLIFGDLQAGASGRRLRPAA